MKKLPIGVQSFEVLRTEQFIYVDKTSYLYKLITSNRIYFLSRPRRFGKSLLISTLEAIFKAKRALFAGLWIAQSNYEWIEYPVIRIDMSLVNSTSLEQFQATLIERLLTTAKYYGLELVRSTDAVVMLSHLIEGLAQKLNPVVVLIDEYDKPILDNVGQIDLARAMRDILRQLYTVLKAQDEYIRFVLLTGVTRFSKVSVFSGLNNLQDLTLDNRYASLLGYTQQELETVFASWIKRLAQKHQHTAVEELADIQCWYNGYQFASEGERVYNPFSTLLLFEQQAYRAHWFETGTPTFLLHLIQDQKFDMTEIVCPALPASGKIN